MRALPFSASAGHLFGVVLVRLDELGLQLQLVEVDIVDIDWAVVSSGIADGLYLPGIFESLDVTKV